MTKARNDYESDRRDSDAYIPAACGLLAYLFSGELFIVSTPDEDMKKASDLKWLRSTDVGGKNIALRVRWPDVWDKYKYDFTIRARRKNGARTEFSKIVEDGHGDYLLYAHACPVNPRKLAHHWLINLQKFRECFCNGLIALPGERSNGDGTYFYPFDVRKMPNRVVMFGSDADLCGDKITKTPKASTLFTASKSAKGKSYSGLLFSGESA